MPDREKVIRGLEIQLDDLQKYTNADEILTLTQEQAKEIVALLKEQDAVSITTDYVDGFGNQTSHCPSCNSRLTWQSNMHYCGECGQPVLWEGR